MRMRTVRLSTDNQAEKKNLTNIQTGMFSKNLSIPVFLFISTLYLKLGNKRKMIAVSTQISGTEIGAERFLSAIFLIIF